MNATLRLLFKCGPHSTYREIQIEKVIELDVPDRGRNEISFRETAKGWIMAVSKPLLDGPLADEFLTVRKNVV